MSNHRPTHLATLPCDSCDGLGYSQFEPVCVNCTGTGRVREEVYTDCGHSAEDDSECRDEGCMCEVQVDLGVFCAQAYAATVHEPFTPAAFELRCCTEHARDLLDQGYLRGESPMSTLFPLEHPPLQSLTEAEGVCLTCGGPLDSTGQCTDSTCREYTAAEAEDRELSEGQRLGVERV